MSDLEIPNSNDMPDNKETLDRKKMCKILIRLETQISPKLFQPCKDTDCLIDLSFLEIIDDDWKSEELPYEEIEVPLEKLSDPNEFEPRKMTLEEKERRWLDQSLANLRNLFKGEDQVNIEELVSKFQEIKI
uniref:Anaphase-promoting complex subunit 13 n=1 Tax=Clastoptera arizonana TaxID=38151 RepID=A0A1B6CMV1_9HEMI